MMKHRFQLISIIILSFLLLKTILIVADTNADISELLQQNNDNSVSIDEEKNNNDNRNATGGNTINMKDNDKLSVVKTIKAGDGDGDTSQNKNNNENKSKLAWDARQNDESSPNVEDEPYDSLYTKPFTELYDIGVQAYLENNWNDCIVYLELSMHEFKVYRQGIINCRLQCQYKNEREEPFYEVATDGLQFYDLILKRTVCLNNCYKNVLKRQYLPPFFVTQYYFERFLNMRPYEYLQLCYYKVS